MNNIFKKSSSSPLIIIIIIIIHQIYYCKLHGTDFRCGKTKPCGALCYLNSKNDHSHLILDDYWDDTEIALFENLLI
ncbi:hypothetical protein Glove_63g59 [Diversispora epigaea]|nr:hypothetical protein Glove_63g59 [Diversispora epigaea]